MPLYPNRKLSLKMARTRPEDAYSPESMANVALANLCVGEIVVLGPQRRLRVAAISEKRLVLVGTDGRRRSYDPFGELWDQLVRDVVGALLAAAHRADAGDLASALRRDPAFVVDKEGFGYLADPQGGVVCPIR